MNDSATLPHAIVLGTGVNGLGVLRSLGRLGVKCGALSIPSANDQAIYSRYLKARLDVPESASDELLISRLNELREAIGPGSPVLIPTSDRFAQFLAENQAHLSEKYLFRCAKPSLYDAFLDKWKTAQICAEHQMPIPLTECPYATSELEEIAGRLPFPVIIKPRYTFDKTFPGKNAIAATSEELYRFFDDHEVLGSAVVQQIIPSGDGDIIVVATYSGEDGTVRAIYSGRKLRQWRPDYGATCFGISERHPDLERLCEDFLEQIGYRGLAALEFARSREDGKMYFIELNTRSYLHNQLFADAGIDLTVCAYHEITGRDRESPPVMQRQRENLIWLDFRRDYASMMQKRERGEISLWGWALSLLRARSFAYWDWRDPLPYAMACVRRIRRFIDNRL